jgi:hypothetical protein
MPTALTAILMLCILCLEGCASNRHTVALSASQCEELWVAANMELSRPGNMDLASGEYRRAAWPKPIQRLRPIAVYSHLANVVIVLSRDAHVERGYYVILAISSFIPMKNNSEWSWKRIGDNVYEYVRTR